MTRTIPSDIRKAAKRMAREGGVSHQNALDLMARDHGHAGWGALLASRKAPEEPKTALTRLIDEAWALGATAIHVESRRGSCTIFVRVHQKRRILREMDFDTRDELMMHVDEKMPRITDDRAPRDGGFACTLGGRTLDVQIASTPADDGEMVTMRLPDRYVEGLTLEQLGIRQITEWLDVCRSGPGLVLVSGKTGAGKSTTIAKTIERLRREGVDVVGENDGDAFHQNRIGDVIAMAATRTVLLEVYGSSLDRAIADVMNRGLGNGVLTRLFRGGIHQELIPREVGPSSMSSVVLPWRT